ncbi:hypothetical protein SCREM2_gp110 [Synechococcus phage S-CREM2]|nr:hypothetical protein SCREM2_gp110 [Synechococcus phage S-CREM2]
MKHALKHIDQLVYIALTLGVAGSLSIVYASSFKEKEVGCSGAPPMVFHVTEVHRSKSCLCKEVTIATLESVELGYMSAEEAEDIQSKCWALPSDVF